jgi:AcrR family transcriptional regulator
VVAYVLGETPVGLRERKKQRTRATLIDAAVELCVRHGYERTTVEQIAAHAEVSPRTFSRYFETKDAVVLAVIADALEAIAAELTLQPADISELDALVRACVAVINKAAARAGRGAERVLASTRIMMSSPALRQAAAEFRPAAVNRALAARMGLGLGDRRINLVSSVWAAIMLTALEDVGDCADWRCLEVGDIIARVERTYGQFADMASAVRQPA